MRGGAIGDFVLTLPVLRVIRTQWPATRVTVVAAERVARLALAGGLVDETRSLDDAIFASLFTAAPLPDATAAFLSGFDAVMCLLHDPEGTVVEHLRHCVSRVAAGSPIVTGGHAADVLAAPLAALGIPVPKIAVPVLQLPVALKDATRRLLPGSPQHVVTLHPGSGSPAKNWPLSCYSSLCRRLREDGHAPVAILGEAECGMRADVEATTAVGAVLGNCDLVTLAGVLANSSRGGRGDAGRGAVRRDRSGMLGAAQPGRTSPARRGGWRRHA
jgi:heptosyltransferase-3